MAEIGLGDLKPSDLEVGPELNLKPEENSEFLNLTYEVLSDGKVTKEEVTQIQLLIEKYNIDKSEIKKITKTELEKIIMKTEDYSKSLELIGTNKNEIKNIQYSLGTRETGKFSVSDFVAFKVSPFYKNEVFRNIDEFKNGRLLKNEDISSFANNLLKLNMDLGYDGEELLNILAFVEENSFVLLNHETGDIEIYNEVGDKTVFTKGERDPDAGYNVVPNLDAAITNIFSSPDFSRSKKLNSIIALLNQKSTPADIEKYIAAIKRNIKEGNLFEDARDVFSFKTSKGIKIDLPNYFLAKSINAFDIFGDFVGKTLLVNGVKYKFEGEDLIPLNGKGGKLLIRDGRTYNYSVVEDSPIVVEEPVVENEPVQAPKESDDRKEVAGKDLSKEFNNWLINGGMKRHFLKRAGGCGAGVRALLDGFFLEYKIKPPFKKHRIGKKNSFFKNGANGKDWQEMITRGETRRGKEVTKKFSKAEEKKYSEAFDTRINFKKLPINSYDEIIKSKDLMLLCYNGGTMSSKTRTVNGKRIPGGAEFGHVEIGYNTKAGNREFRSSYFASYPGGSGGKRMDKSKAKKDFNYFKKATGFTGAYTIELNVV